jgi:hypothetical protein
MCPPDTLEIFCSYFMCRVNAPGVGHYWNKDPHEAVFLFQLWPFSMGVAQHKAHPNFKKQGPPFCKMKWHDQHTVIWQVFHFKKCSSRYNVPSKTASNLMYTCSNMFQFPHRVDISSWCPLELYTSIVKIADHTSHKWWIPSTQVQIHNRTQITQTVCLSRVAKPQVVQI